MKRAACLALALAAWPLSARADDCADAYEQAQRFRQAGRLRAALDRTIACARPECPLALRKDCTEWIDATRASVPSIALRVQGPDGCDVEQATVEIDGEIVTTRLDGRAFDVDPGAHALRVSISGEPPAERRLTIAEGERSRPLQISFARVGRACGTKPDEPRRLETVTTRPVPTVTWVLTGVGAVSLLVSSGFLISGFSQKSDLEPCRPRCAPDDADAMRRAFLVGDVALVTGVLALGAAAIVYLTRPERTSPVVPVTAFGPR